MTKGLQGCVAMKRNEQYHDLKVNYFNNAKFKTKLHLISLLNDLNKVNWYK